MRMQGYEHWTAPKFTWRSLQLTSSQVRCGNEKHTTIITRGLQLYPMKVINQLIRHFTWHLQTIDIQTHWKNAKEVDLRLRFLTGMMRPKYIQNFRENWNVKERVFRQLLLGKPSNIFNAVMQALQGGPGKRFRWCCHQKDKRLPEIDKTMDNYLKISTS